MVRYEPPAIATGSAASSLAEPQRLDAKERDTHDVRNHRTRTQRCYDDRTAPDSSPAWKASSRSTPAIAEPDKDGGSLRYRGVDIDDLVGRVGFDDVWALLVDDAFGSRLPVDTSPPPFRSGDVRVDVQASLPLLAPARGFGPLLDITDRQARDHLAADHCGGAVLRRAVRARRRDRRCPQPLLAECSTVVERFLTAWLGEPTPGAGHAPSTPTGCRRPSTG